MRYEQIRCMAIHKGTSLRFGRRIRNEEVNLNELRANSMIQRFDSETNRNVALIFSKGYPRRRPFRVAICRWFMCPVMRRLGYDTGQWHCRD